MPRRDHEGQPLVGVPHLVASNRAKSAGGRGAESDGCGRMRLVKVNEAHGLVRRGQ